MEEGKKQERREKGVGRGRRNQAMFCGVRCKARQLLNSFIQELFIEHDCADTSPGVYTCGPLHPGSVTAATLPPGS